MLFNTFQSSLTCLHTRLTVYNMVQSHSRVAGASSVHLGITRENTLRPTQSRSSSSAFNSILKNDISRKCLGCEQGEIPTDIFPPIHELQKKAYKWEWECCRCGQHGIRVSIDPCPNCAKPRCAYCPLTKIRVRSSDPEVGEDDVITLDEESCLEAPDVEGDH